MDKISFVIIGYNVERYIKKCISSIINQSDKNIEIIFVDDGSTDGTRKIVQDMFKNDNRCKYIFQKNMGANVARVTGFNNANGKYITFIDGDDWIDEDLAKETREYFNNGEYDFICYNFYFYFEDGKKIINTKFKDKIYNYDEYLKDILQSKTPHYIWNKVYKYEFLKKINFDKIPKITMGDDLAVNVRMGVETPTVLSCNKAYYFYYLKKNSISQKFNPKYIEILKALNYIENIVKKSIFFNDNYKKMIDYQYFLAFYYYVVKSKYNTTHIQRSINYVWKSKNINIENNIYIMNYINKIKKLEKILFKVYNYNYYLGYYLSRIYLKFKYK